jgi:hypothetical protein
LLCETAETIPTFPDFRLIGISTVLLERNLSGFRFSIVEESVENGAGARVESAEDVFSTTAER